MARRVYALDGQQVTSVEQLAPNAHYLCVPYCASPSIYLISALIYWQCAALTAASAARSVCANEPLALSALPAALEEALARARPGAAVIGAPAELTAATSRELAQAGARGGRSGSRA